MSDPLAARKTHWRDNLEAIAAAIVLALLLKAFALEAYKIPTGSMQPTLMGLNTPEFSISDRIVVDKFTYAVRDPERFEVAVFRFPLDRSKNYVKRIVGMPNEQLRVQNGDLWVRPGDGDPWTVLRRPGDVQETHWKSLDDPWVAEAGPLTNDGSTLVASNSGVFRFGRRDESITDRYFDGYLEAVRERVPTRDADGPRNTNLRQRHKVGDLKVAGDMVAEANTFEIEVELREGPRTYRFRVPGPAAPADARPSIEVETESGRGLPGDAQLVAPAPERAREPWRLTAGTPTRFAVENLDDRLRLVLGDALDLTLDVPAVASQNSAIRVRFSGPGRLAAPRVWRDVYYTARGTYEWTIPDASYVMLGDNTQDSSDSREWTLERFALVDTVEGRSGVLRGNKRQGENPIELETRDELFFVDEWGQRHWLAEDVGRAAADPVREGFVEVTGLGEEPAPFVSRDMITGRAIAVFWPIRPLAGIVRLEWIH
ncbi:Signal peptidase I [Planctomycetes bacterium Pla163]|uniref:Signal peptidase I n=1 Tax=Rohdeia mirabilis TaxID=2528008 RepID=A0A518D3Y4_9BACT|nr:Signal peptidase I [Planctomycetes bacterium Pla163]